MPEAKHTPGPWRVSSEILPVTVYDSSGGNEIARVGEKWAFDYHQERVANAILIAKTPDMYEALNAILAISSVRTSEHDKIVTRIAEEVIREIPRDADTRTTE